MVDSTAALCRADEPSTTAQIDADTIRETYEVVLGTAGSRELVGELLLGHVQLLLPEVADRVSRMTGEWRLAAEHAVGQTRRMLDEGVDLDGDLWELAIRCRSLLALNAVPAPLPEPSNGAGHD
jgi:hypothetical protein